MTTKNYEKRCARLVQEAAATKYMTALRWVREHLVAHPEMMLVEAWALAVVDSKDDGRSGE